MIATNEVSKIIEQIREQLNIVPSHAPADAPIELQVIGSKVNPACYISRDDLKRMIKRWKRDRTHYTIDRDNHVTVCFNGKYARIGR